MQIKADSAFKSRIVLNAVASTLCIAFVLLGSGCGQNTPADAVSTKVNGATNRPMAVVSLKGPPLRVTGLSSEAQKLLQSLIAEHFTYYKDLWVGRCDDVVFEFAKVTLQTVPGKISEADRRNGSDWNGIVLIQSQAVRAYKTPDGWSEWREVTPSSMRFPETNPADMSPGDSVPAYNVIRIAYLWKEAGQWKGAWVPPDKWTAFGNQYSRWIAGVSDYDVNTVLFDIKSIPPSEIPADAK